MFRLIPLSLFLLALLPVPSFAAEFTADSALRAVTVYTNRAALTRRAVVDIPAGAHTVVFENLPANLMPDSLRAEGEAEASVTFGAVSYKMVASAELAQIRERELAAPTPATSPWGLSRTSWTPCRRKKTRCCRKNRSLRISASRRSCARTRISPSST